MAMTSETYTGDVSEFLSGAYFRKEDFADSDESLPLRIAGVERVEFVGPKGPDTKLQVTFADEPKKLTLNQTNLKNLIKYYGKRTSDWIGKPVLLYLDENVMFAGNNVGGLRLRIPKPGKPKPVETAPADDGGDPF